MLQKKQLLQQSRKLLNQIQEDIVLKRFSSDDVNIKIYNDLIEAISQVFLDDPVLNGQLVKMPDAVLQTYMPEHGGFLPFWAMPPQLPSERLKAHLTRLINRMEILLGEEPTQELIDVLDFFFILDEELREVLRLDFVEAQKSLSAEAHKACCLLCSGLIEGMLLDIVQKSSVESIDRDKISLTKLIEMAGRLSMVSKTVLKFAEGARDIRDTVHPRAEVRQGHRSRQDEADLLLQLVRLIYNDLVVNYVEREKS